MSDEQPTSGTTTNPATAAHAPRQATPVMDVTPPPVTPAPSPASPEPEVVAAPTELPDVPQISDDIADQIAVDSTTPPAPEPSVVSSPDNDQPTAPVDAPAETAPTPTEAKTPDAGDSPSDLIQAEINRDEDKPAPAPVKTPKPANPVGTAVVATVILTIVLAGLAVFAYMSSQK